MDKAELAKWLSEDLYSRLQPFVGRPIGEVRDEIRMVVKDWEAEKRPEYGRLSENVALSALFSTLPKGCGSGE